MKRTLLFAKRSLKEIYRDPVSIVFCVGLPVFLLVLFQQFNLPGEIYTIKAFAPGMIIFSFSFISLFSAQLISKDRTSSFLARLFASPMKVGEFILGYTLSLWPVALTQTIIFIAVAIYLGLDITLKIFFFTLLITLLVSLLFIGLGILIGSLLNDKQAPGCSSIVVQLVAFTSGLWFPIDSISKQFQLICNILPFRYALTLMRNTIAGKSIDLKILLYLIVFIFIIFVLAIFVFYRKKINDNKA